MRAPALKTTLLTLLLALPSVLTARTVPTGSEPAQPPLTGPATLVLTALTDQAPVTQPVLDLVNTQTYARGARIFLLGEPQALSPDGAGIEWEVENVDDSSFRAFWTVPADQPLGNAQLVTRLTNGTVINMPIAIVEPPDLEAPGLTVTAITHN